MKTTNKPDLGNAAGGKLKPPVAPHIMPLEPPWMMPLSSPGGGFDFNDPPAPEYHEAVVHDPSVFYAGGYFYVIGSHMAMARTTDFIKWEQISRFATADNPLIDPDDYADAFAWSESRTFWAGDIQPMPDGRFFLYYCNCQGSKPLGNIGLAIADAPDGVYKNQGIFLKSGMDDKTVDGIAVNNISEDGTPYDANIHPNCVDPHAFFDNDGQFWMLYGSFSGGIFILRMDEKTGLPLPDQGYGIKLMGGNHGRLEGPYMQYSPETGYYYMFVSFGGLGPAEGYNIRVARSRSVTGPFVDARGQDMIDCKGAFGTMFDDKSIEPYGTKIVGGYWFMQEPGEPGRNTTGHLSPGHNSTYRDPDSGRYYCIFHQRFAHTRRRHEVRVHEMWLNEDGWFVMSPFRAVGGKLPPTESAHLHGTWKIINHGQHINYTCNESTPVNFNPDGTIIGRNMTGAWTLDADGTTLRITLNDTIYTGRPLRCYNADCDRWVMAFTVMSTEGIALWGAGLAPAKPTAN